MAGARVAQLLVAMLLLVNTAFTPARPAAPFFTGRRTSFPVVLRALRRRAVSQPPSTF